MSASTGKITWYSAQILRFYRPSANPKTDEFYTRKPMVALVEYRGTGRRSEVDLEYVVLGYDDRVCYQSDIGYTDEWNEEEWKPKTMEPELVDCRGGYPNIILFPSDENYETPEGWEEIVDTQGDWSFYDDEIYEKFKVDE